MFLLGLAPPLSRTVVVARGCPSDKRQSGLPTPPALGSYTEGLQLPRERPGFRTALPTRLSLAVSEHVLSYLGAQGADQGPHPHPACRVWWAAGDLQGLAVTGVDGRG